MKLTIVIITALLMSSCGINKAYKQTGGIKETEENRTKAISQANEWKDSQFPIIKKKFSFDTDCEISNIELIVIETYSDANGEANYDKEKWRMTTKPYCKLDWIQHQIMPKTIGAKGCGKKGTYIHLGNSWVLNSSTNQK